MSLLVHSVKCYLLHAVHASICACFTIQISTDANEIALIKDDASSHSPVQKVRHFSKENCPK